MIKKVSLTSLVSVIVFMATLYANARIDSFDKSRIGWPLVFFATDPEKEIMAGTHFSFLRLCFDLFISVAIAFLLVTLFSFGKKETRKLA